MAFQSDKISPQARAYHASGSAATELLRQARIYWLSLFVAEMCFNLYLLLRVFVKGVPANSAAPFVFIFIYAGVCTLIAVYSAVNKLKISDDLTCAVAAAIVYVPMMVFTIYFGAHGINVAFPLIMLVLGSIMASGKVVFIRESDFLTGYIFICAVGVVLAVLALILGLFAFSGTDRRWSGKLERNVTYCYDGEGGYTVERVWRTLGRGGEVVLQNEVRRRGKNVALVGIDGGAFSHYDYDTVSLPASVTSIFDNAFSASGVRAVYATGGLKLKTGNNAFSDSEVRSLVTDCATVDLGGALGEIGEREFAVRLDTGNSALSFDNSTVGKNVIFEVNGGKVESYRAANENCADRFIPIVKDNEIYITVNDDDGSAFGGRSVTIGKKKPNGKYAETFTVSADAARRTRTINGKSVDEQLVLMAGGDGDVFYIKEQDGAKKFMVDTDKSLRLYAAWSPIRRIELDLSSEEAGFVGDRFDGTIIEFCDDLDGKADEIALPTEDDVARDGYAFIGWYKGNSSQRRYYGNYYGRDGVKPLKVTDEMGDLKLTAHFERYFSITFVGADVAQLIESGTVDLPDGLTQDFRYHALSGEIVLPDLDGTRDGYTFVGWYDNSAYIGGPRRTVAAGSVGDITLYAKWTEK